MLRLKVFVEVGDEPELLLADGALELALQQVHGAVSREGRGVREGLGALRALARPLARVGADVVAEVVPQEEGLVAIVALVSPLPGVEPLVDLEGAGVGERLGAEGAGVRLLARVRAEVHGQVLGDEERLVAEHAAEVSVGRVLSADVEKQHGLLGERPSANGAVEGSVAGVRDHVRLQGMLAGHRLVADGTLISATGSSLLGWHPGAASTNLRNALQDGCYARANISNVVCCLAPGE